MVNPFEIGSQRYEIFKLIEEKYKIDPSASWKAHQWMNTPNPLLCGITPDMYIESGKGDKLIAMLKEVL